MKPEIAIIKSKSFQALFNDADYLLEESRKLHLLFSESLENGGIPNQELLSKERTLARASIIASVASLEALVTIILLQFKKREMGDIDPSWLSSKIRKRDFDNHGLKEKLIMCPVLCNDNPKEPSDYFKSDESDILALAELYQIRNGLAHGKVVNIKYEILSKPLHFTNKFKDNFWPNTGLPRDIFEITYKDAKKTNFHILRLTKKLIYFLEGQVTEKFLLTQTLRSNTQTVSVIRENKKKSGLSWYEFVLNKDEI